jgi:hypothetical protein
MRTVRYTSRFRRDYRRERSERHGKRLDVELLKTVNMLAEWALRAVPPYSLTPSRRFAPTSPIEGEVGCFSGKTPPP